MVKLPEKYKMLKVMQKLKNFNRSISAKVFDDMVNDLSLKKKKTQRCRWFSRRVITNTQGMLNPYLRHIVPEIRNHVKSV